MPPFNCFLDLSVLHYCGFLPFCMHFESGSCCLHGEMTLLFFVIASSNSCGGTDKKVDWSFPYYVNTSHSTKYYCCKSVFGLAENCIVCITQLLGNSWGICEFQNNAFLGLMSEMSLKLHWSTPLCFRSNECYANSFKH